MKSLLFVSGLLFILQAEATTVQSPFDRSLDLTPVERILEGSPQDLVGTIRASGVQIYLFPKVNADSEDQVSGFLKGVTRLSSEQYKRFGFEELGLNDSEGLFVSEGDPCCDLKQNMIVVSDNLDPITLVHEFAHSAFYQQLSSADKELHKTAEAEVERAQRVFRFRFDKVFRNPALLEDHLWRRDLMNALVDYRAAAERIIRFNISEEIMIERSLQKLIQPGSPFYNKNRLETGEKYAQARLKQIRVILGDLAFVSGWSLGEIKVFENTIELREKYEMEKQYKVLDAQIMELDRKYALLSEFQMTP